MTFVNWMRNAIIQVTYFLNKSMINLLFYSHIILFIFIKWPLKFNHNISLEVQIMGKISGYWWKYRNAEKQLTFHLKWKLLKHFVKLNQRAALRNLFRLQLDKSFLNLWNKNFLTEIYRNTETFVSNCFENAVFGSLEMVQCKCFFWDQPETCILGRRNREIQRDFSRPNKQLCSISREVSSQKVVE